MTGGNGATGEAAGTGSQPPGTGGTLRVVMTTPHPDMPGGVATFANALRAAAMPGVEFRVTGPRPGERGFLRRTLRVFSDTRALRRRLAAGGVDLVHINTSLRRNAMVRDGLLARAAAAYGIPCFVLLHGWDPVAERLARGILRLVIGRTLFRAGALCTVATEYAGRLRDMGFAGRVFTTTSLVPDPVAFSPAVNSRPPRTSTSRLRVLYLSRIEPNKGIYETLDAFRIFSARFPEARLTVAGDGSALGAARQYACDHNLLGVTFTGFITGNRKAQAFLDADVFVFPTSYGEGMPHAVLEAMAYALPVATCPVGGLRDFFIDGRMGLLSTSRDPKVLAGWMEEMLRSPARREEIGQFNRRHIQKQFTTSAVMRGLRAAYLDFLNRPSSGAAA